jgi:hypothetical protein
MSAFPGGVVPLDGANDVGVPVPALRVGECARASRWEGAEGASAIRSGA